MRKPVQVTLTNSLVDSKQAINFRSLLVNSSLMSSNKTMMTKAVQYQEEIST